MNVAQPVDSNVPRHYALHWTRCSIRSTATFLYFLAIILYIADGVHCTNLLSSYNEEYDYEVDSSVCWTDGSVGDLRPMLVAIVALIWNVAEHITLCINKRGIHPGANLGMDIVLWLDGMLNGIFSFLLFEPFQEDGIYLAATSILLLASILQFVLFILDCIAVHKWRRSRYGYPMGYVQYPGPNQPQAYAVPQAQPGFVYVQVPANQVGQPQMMQSPMMAYDPRQSMMPYMAAPVSQEVPKSEVSPISEPIPVATEVNGSSSRAHGADM